MATIMFHSRFNAAMIMSWMALILTSCSSSMSIQPNADQSLVANTSTATTVAASTKENAEAPPPPIVNDKNVTLTNLNMENQGNEIMVKPGRSIHATMNYTYNCTDCKADRNSQIIVGLAGRSAQACIYNGGTQGQGSADFTLKMPAKPGRYEVRFRGLQAADCAEALKAGWNADNTPKKESTIGKIIVSRKASA